LDLSQLEELPLFFPLFLPLLETLAFFESFLFFLPDALLVL
jgi:hypothetical protein